MIANEENGVKSAWNIVTRSRAILERVYFW